MHIRSDGIAIFQGLERPVRVIALVARMLTGLGLAIALFLQTYMYILTDLRCDPEAASLGNVIRCTEPLDMVVAALFLVIGIGVAAALFLPQRLDLPETVLMVLCVVAIRFVASLDLASATWEIALTLVALFSAIAGLWLLRRLYPRSPPRSD